MSKVVPVTAAASDAMRPLDPQTAAAPREAIATVSVVAPSSVVRLQLFSDLHHDVRPAALPTLAPGADVVVVAGDTCEGPQRAFEHLRRAIPAPTPIVMVLGNHESYRGFLPEVIADARQLAPAYGITLLEDSAAVVAGTRFLGCTLWTDYALDSRQDAAMLAARHGLNDHRMIGWQRSPWLRFRPEEALAVHRASQRFLADAMAVPFAGPTVVVTHHAPHPGSVHPRYAGDALNPTFASDLSELIAAGRPALWVHGHVHSSFDYLVDRTRLVCNPHGYGNENPTFDPHLTVGVAR